MSNAVVAEDIRLRLAQSLAVVEGNREAIIEKMQQRLVAAETEDEAFGQGEITAMMLIDLLVGAASDLAACGGLANLEGAAADHKRLGIDGRHYSRFGMALAPVLREALGPRLPPKIASAWCDAFWFVIRQLNSQAAPDRKTRLLNLRFG
jgi:hemoglobin-like flavoprotein